jgi:hypothetical protein
MQGPNDNFGFQEMKGELLSTVNKKEKKIMARRDDFLIGPKEKAVEAIKAGKTKEALAYLNDVYEQFHALHDAYSNDISFLEGTLAKTLGDKGYEAFERKKIFELLAPKYERYKGMSAEQKVGAICNSMRAHYSEFHVEEDDEKFVVAMTGCGAGGRLVKDGLAKRQDAITKKAYPWSFDRVGFPYYCVHAYFLNELFKERGIKILIEYGRQYDDQGNKINEPCKYYVYK